VTDKIRIYGLEGNNEFIPQIAQEYAIKVAVTLLLTGDDIADQEKITQAAYMANSNDAIYTIIVENEGLYRGTLNEEQIINYLVRIKEKLNTTCTVTISEPSYIWLEHPEIAKHVDYLTIHYYPYWGGVKIDNAVNKVFDVYYEIRDTFGKEVVIGETGWPSSGRNLNQAVPSLGNQQIFVREFREIADARDIDYFFFEAFDETWKPEEVLDSEEGPNYAENHWGLFYENGTMKESLRGVIPSSLYDTTRK